MPGIDVLAARPDRAGVFVDFDGTLSEIAPTPEGAGAVPDAAATLEAVAGVIRVVAVVSGRRAQDVSSRLGLAADSPIRCYGLYGLEDRRGVIGADPAELERKAREILPDVERAAALVPGSRVEWKGLQVAVHYRGVPEPAAARRVLLERLAEPAGRQGMALLEGKMVVEVAPAGGRTKGEPVLEVARAESLRAILYAGDDLADLDAFAALDGMAAEGAETVRVAVRSAETPPELVERADIEVDGPAGLLGLLVGLAGQG
jgi:trehalose 6-phosphate phosphatase